MVDPAIVRRLREENKMSYREIGKVLNCCANTARNTYLGKKKEKKKKPGPKPIINEKVKLTLKRAAAALFDREEKVTARKVMEDLNVNVNIWSVRKALRELKFTYQNIKKKIVLTQQHKDKRLELARKWLDTSFDWNDVIFSDEKRFNLDGPDSWCSWIREGQEIERNKRQQGGQQVQIWGMILPDGKLIIKQLHQRSRSSDYIDLIQNFVMPQIDFEFGYSYKFQQDNASIHASKETRDWMVANKFPVMEWPSRSPDLNPIENVWSLLSQEVYKGPQFKNAHDLIDQIYISVRKLNLEQKEKILNIRNSMPCRLRKLCENKGNLLKY